MKPQKQLIGHNPDDDRWGDCYRTCVAVIVDMEAGDVPHFCDGGVDDGAQKCRAWLGLLGFTYFTCYYLTNVSLGEILRTHEHLNPGVPYILTGAGPRGCNHSVVCVGGEIVCDPYTGGPNPEALVGPANGPEGECYWWIEVIAKGCAA